MHLKMFYKTLLVFLVPNILNHLLSWLKTVPTNSKVFLRGLLNTREKQILTNVIEIPKTLGVPRIFRR